MKLWIARDKNNLLFLYFEKPNKIQANQYLNCEGDIWLPSKGDQLNIRSDSFSEVQWLDAKPTEGKIRIAKRKDENNMKLWIARDKNNSLSLYSKKPRKSQGDVWLYYEGNLMKIFWDNFPEVKWSDAEPTEVELKIVKHKK